MARPKKDNPRKMTNGIRRTADLKRWEAAVSTGEKDKDGKPVYEWITGETRKEVEILRDEIKNKVNHGRYISPSQYTLGEFMDEWIEVYKTNIDDNTYELYKMYIRKHIKPSIGHIPLQDIIPMTLQKFYNEKLKKQSPNTVRKYHSLLRNSLNSAKINRLIIDNPAVDVTPPKKVKFVPNVLAKEDFFKLLDAVKGTYDEIYIVLGGCLGLRRGEVIGLRWGDVNFKNKTITINRTVTRFVKEREKDPKNESSQRTIKAPQFVIDTLEEYKKNQKVISMTNRICSEYKPQSYSHHFKKLTSDLGITGIRYHDLRHFAAVILLLKGVPDKVVAGMLGHAQVTTLRETYQHIIDEMKTQAADVMDNFMESRS